MTVVLFWTCVGLIAYTYGGFALLLALRARLWPRPYHASEITPPVSLLIAAHNEAAVIQSRLENALALDYPAEQLEVIVASDGSTDGTDQIVRRFAGRRVRLLSLPRRGKMTAINAAVAASTGDVLVFSDANSMFEAGAVRALMRPLADPRVGGVAGNQRYVPADQPGADEGERRYWDYDRCLKRWQSAAGNVTAATGAIYAVRRALFRAVPDGVTDDTAVSTAVIAQGYRLVFAGDAVAYESPAATAQAEFARKVRIINPDLQCLIEHSSLFNPFRYGFYSLQLFSHKVLRRLVPFPLLALLLISPWLWTAGPLYQLAVVAQAAVYLLAAFGWALKGTRLGRLRLFTLPLFFVLVNLASFLAVCSVLRGRRIVTWQTARPPAPAAEATARGLPVSTTVSTNAP